MWENIHFIPPAHLPLPRAEAKDDGPASTDDDFDADLIWQLEKNLVMMMMMWWILYGDVMQSEAHNPQKPWSVGFKGGTYFNSLGVGCGYT